MIARTEPGLRRPSLGRLAAHCRTGDGLTENKESKCLPKPEVGEQIITKMSQIGSERQMRMQDYWRIPPGRLLLYRSVSISRMRSGNGRVVEFAAIVRVSEHQARAMCEADAVVLGQMRRPTGERELEKAAA